MLWLYLHFPHLSADHLTQQEQPHQPIIVVDVAKKNILQCNKAALAAGIKPHMTLANAALLCEDLQVVSNCEQRQERCLNALAQQLYQVSACISIKAPDGLLLEVSSMLKLYGSLLNYIENVSSVVQQHSVSFMLGLGFSPLSAQVLARANLCIFSEDEGLLKNELAALPLDAAVLGEVAVNKLSRMGIKTFAALFALPINEVGVRLGADTVRTVQRLLADVPDLQIFYEPPEYFEHYVELLHEAEHVKSIQFVTRRLLSMLSDYLTARQLTCGELQLHLSHRDLPDTKVVIGIANSAQQAEKLLPLISLYLDKTTIEAPITGVKLLTSNLLSPVNHSTKKFDFENDAPAFLQELESSSDLKTPEELISHLQARLGNKSVHGLHMTDDHRPERESNYDLVAQPTAEYLPRLRPSLILPTPILLTRKVKVLSGPERIQTGWWDDQHVERDYFIAQDEQGKFCWIYRERGGRWFLHGYFA